MKSSIIAILSVALVFLSQPLRAETLYEIRNVDHDSPQWHVWYVCIESSELPVIYTDPEVGHVIGSNPIPPPEAGAFMAIGADRAVFVTNSECLSQVISSLGRMGFTENDFIVSEVD